MDSIDDHKNPIIVTQHGIASINALGIMKLIQISEKAIQEGNVYSNEEVFSELRKNNGYDT
jgi:hypothetical protein